MKRTLLLLLVLPTMSWANIDPGCAKIGASMYIDLVDAIAHDLHINRTELKNEETRVEVLATLPVSRVFAAQLADSDYKQQTGVKLTKKDLFDSYYDNGAKSITAKYTFINAKGQSNIFIVSSLFNNDECTIRFNG